MVPVEIWALCVWALLISGCSAADPHAASEDEGRPPEHWLSTVQTSIASSEYQLREQPGGGLRFSSRAQGLRARFHADGTISITPRGGEAGPLRARLGGWEMALRTTSWGREGAMTEVGAGGFRVGSCAPGGRTDERGECLKRAEGSRAGLTEWWGNDEHGLEQGWTLDEAPAGDGPLVLEVAVEGAEALVAEDGTSAMLSTRTNRLRYAGLLAMDATGRRLPTHLAPTPGGLRVVVDDRHAILPVEIDPLLTTETWAAEVDQAGALFGSSVASAGDVNGDGYSDVVVGAPAYDDGESDEGAVFVYLGSPSGLPSSASWSTQSDQDGANLGGAVSSAGDVNGDGYADIVAGASDFEDGQTSEGAAFVYLGSASGPVAPAAWTAQGDQYMTQFGYAVSSAGDVNGDGYSDVVVGDIYHDGDATGCAFVFLGSTTGLEPGHSWSQCSDQTQANYGSSVASAGDVDGDGYDDVIVGALVYNNGELDEGAAFVYMGSATGPALTPAWTGESNQAGAQYGNSVSSAGDVDGDGYSDVVVGARNLGGGHAFLYLGSASGLSASAAWDQGGSGKLGQPVAAAGDVNGDGFADVLVGASDYDNGESDEGAAFLYLGSASGLGPASAWSWESDQVEAYLGRYTGLAAAGDVNGDGFGDVIVAAREYDAGQTDEGRSWLFYGAGAGLTEEAAWTAQGDQEYSQLGYSVASAGDLDGDGYDDVVVGANERDGVAGMMAGAAFVHMGGPDGPAPSPDWSAEGNQLGARLGASVAGAGDVDCDGFADLVVGEFNTNYGTAHVWLGGPTGLALAPDWTAEGVQTSSEFGRAVSGAGDVNGDGCSDLVIGAESYDGVAGADAGAAYVFFGSSSGPSTSADWTAEGPAADGSFGAAVASSGDLDGDGFGDILVGAYEHATAAGASTGAAHAFLGSPSGPGSVAAWSREGGQQGEQYGRSLASAADVNGDGFSDVVVGAPAFDCDDGSNCGRVEVFLGSATGLPGAVDWSVDGETQGAWFGYSAASAGDVDADGYGDLVVGAWGDGTATLFLGAEAGPSSTPGWVGSGAERFGWSVASAGDTNGDGYGDLLVGNYNLDGVGGNSGAALVHLGGGADETGPPLVPARPQARRVGETTPVVPGALTEASGAFDAAVFSARSPFGRGGVALQVEAKPLGTPFDGTGLVQPSTFTDSTTDGEELQQTVSGLTDGTPHHWRARVLYDPAGGLPQGWSHWYYGGHSGDPLGAHLRPGVSNTAPQAFDDSLEVVEDVAASIDVLLNDVDAEDALVYADVSIVADGTIGTCSVDSTQITYAPDPDQTGGDLCTYEICDTAGLCDTAEITIVVLADLDGDGTPDVDDPDDDGDTVDDASDLAPQDPTACTDADSDGCDDCAVTSGPPDPTDDGLDTDSDGVCDLGDTDDDGDGIPDDEEGDGDTDGDDIPDALDLDDTDGPIADPDDDGLTNEEEEAAGTDPDVPDSDGDGDLDGDDCAPLDGEIGPGLEEVCDGEDIDNDCDPQTGNDIDADGDGYTLCDGDCDDSEPTVHPGADEVCDGLDNDCDPGTMEVEADEDGDGVRVCDGDCDDQDANTWPDAPELCDGADNDCDGYPETPEEIEFFDWFADVDGDGWGGTGSPHPDNPLCSGPEGYALDGGDCDDDDPEAFPGAEEVCADDIDQDCDGTEAEGGEDPECWAGGCSDCASSLPAPESGSLLVLLVLPFLLPRRRRRRTSLDVCGTDGATVGPDLDLASR